MARSVRTNQEYRDAIFVITEERSCPIYNAGEELKIEGMGLTVPEAKPVCLKLVSKLAKIASTRKALARFSAQGVQSNKFECGGCEGLIRFEFKKEREFSTVQMKLLAAAELKERMRHVDKFFNVIRGLDVFEPLDEDSLRDLSSLLELKKYRPNKVILKKGDPGTSLYIIVEGKVAIMSEDNVLLSEIGVGGIFGEMSLLSGEPVTTSVYSKEATRLASLTSKDFKHLLNKFPVLQVFFYRLLVERAQANTMKAGSISSGMSGRLSDIHPVELFQLINSSTKTGRVDMVLENGNAAVIFYGGELLRVNYGALEGKEAFFKILGKTEGSFTYTSGISEEEKKLPIIRGFMGLIMEGMRRIDEEADP
ncbi:MAG: Crp/Fnr family transcriptional regulator [Desulfobulbus propionicus]|nr:MAG: Crp/Fnr family transcriptional regulator [Desulfobulbus propionicus]